MSKRVFVTGGTGAVGKELVKELVLNQVDVTTFARRRFQYFQNKNNNNNNNNNENDMNEKIHQEEVDFDKLENYEEKFEGYDAGFCCMGTTKKKAGSAEAFRKVDYEYVIKTAEIAQKKGCNKFYLVSSIGADPNSWFLYPQTKGQVEEKLKQMGFEKLVIYRPSVLIADRGENRFLENISVPFSNLSATYRSMPVEKLARGMVFHYLNSQSAKKPVDIPSRDQPVEVWENKQIHSFVECFKSSPNCLPE